MQRFVRILLIMLVSFACTLLVLTRPTVTTAAGTPACLISVARAPDYSTILLQPTYPNMIDSVEYVVAIADFDANGNYLGTHLSDWTPLYISNPSGGYYGVQYCVRDVRVALHDDTQPQVHRRSYWHKESLERPKGAPNKFAINFTIDKPRNKATVTNLTCSENVTQPSDIAYVHLSSDVNDPSKTDVTATAKLKEGTQWGNVVITIDPEGDTYIFDIDLSESGPGGVGTSAPVFPIIYIGIAAALGAGIVAYFVRRRLIARKEAYSPEGGL